MDRLNISGLSPELMGTLDIKPVASDEQGTQAPENSEIRKIAEDILGAAQLSFTSVAANPSTAVRPGSLEEAFKEGINKMPEQKRTDYVQRAKPLLEATAATRMMMFGRAGERDFASHMAAGGFARYDEGIAPLAIDRKLLGIKNTLTVPIDLLRSSPEGLLIPADRISGGAENFESSFESALNRAAETGVMSADRLEDIWGTSYSSDPYMGGVESSNDDFEEFAVTDKVGLWITEFKCVDETNPEFWGHDEYAVAGVSVDETGDTKKISRRTLGGGYDDGDSKSFPSWRYTYFNMREGNYFPKEYTVSLILAEEDSGGLNDVLNTIWTHIRDRVKAAVQKAIAEALTGLLGPAIASAIGAAAAWVLDKLVGWIISWWKDDIFPAFTAKLRVPSMSARWHYPNGTWGNPSSGIRTAHFYGHGGHCTFKYYWKFHS